MNNQPGEGFNWKQAQEEVERTNAFLEELTRLSCKHMITLAGDVYVEVHEKGGGFKAPCGYVLSPHVYCVADQDMTLNENHTSFTWQTCTSLGGPVGEDGEEDEPGS